MWVKVFLQSLPFWGPNWQPSSHFLYVNVKNFIAAQVNSRWNNDLEDRASSIILCGRWLKLKDSAKPHISFISDIFELILLDSTVYTQWPMSNRQSIKQCLVLASQKTVFRTWTLRNDIETLLMSITFKLSYFQQCTELLLSRWSWTLSIVRKKVFGTSRSYSKSLITGIDTQSRYSL